MGVKGGGGKVAVGMAVWVRATAVHAKGGIVLIPVATGSAVAVVQDASRIRGTIKLRHSGGDFEVIRTPIVGRGHKSCFLHVLQFWE